MGIPQDPGHLYSASSFTWQYSAAHCCIQASFLHIQGHREDGAACRQHEHLNPAVEKSSQALPFGCNFNILQSNSNSALEAKATSLCAPRAQRQYFHCETALFQTERACSIHLHFTASSPVAPEMNFQPPTDMC